MATILKKGGLLVSDVSTTTYDRDTQAAMAMILPFGEYSTGIGDKNKTAEYSEKWIQFNPYTKGLPVRGGKATFATKTNQFPTNIVGIYSKASNHTTDCTYFTPDKTYFAYVDTKLRFFDNFTPQYVTVKLKNNTPEKSPEIILVDNVYVSLDRNGSGRDYLPELNGNVYAELIKGVTYWIEVSFQNTIDNSNEKWVNEANEIQYGFKTKYSWSISETNPNKQ